MKPIITACIIAALISLSAKAQMPDSATAMKNWMDYMTPSKEHEMMTSWNGNWDGDITMWMVPGAPPSKSKSMTENKMILGGRYQQAKHTGSFNGMPFEGMSTLAFDKAKKVFISTWVDNMGTGIMTLEGPWDDAKKSVTLTGNMIEPMSGKEVKVKEIFTVKDNNNQVMEMYAQEPGGAEFKTMEIKYKRKM
jgi:hypothetical protein